MMRLQMVGLYTLVRKEWVRIFRIWPQTLLPSVVTTTLYFLIFGQFIGSRIGLVHNVSYIEFILPGLAMMSVVTNSYTNVVFSVFSSKFQRHIEELLVSPMHELTILTGYILGGVMRGMIVGGLVIGVGAYFTPLHVRSWPLIGVTMLGTSILFSLLGFVNAVYARKFDDVNIVPTFVLTPLTYLGGVFYSVTHLPPMWQKVSLLNPVFYLVNVFRYGFIGISDVPIHYAIGILAVLIIVVWMICYRLLINGIGVRL